MDSSGVKAEFRKPSSETAGRKYRRRSSVSGSSSSDDSPKRDRSSSPKHLRDDASKDSERQPRRKDNEGDLSKDSRSHYNRSSDSYRYSDRKSSRNSHGYSRHDDYARHDKYADEERDNDRLSSRSFKDSKGGSHYDHTRRDTDHSRSRDYFRDTEKSSRDKYDGYGRKSRDGDLLSERHGSGSRRHSNSDEMEKHRNVRDRDGKRDNLKHSGDHKNEWMPSHDDARGNRLDSFSGRDESRHRIKEIYKSDRKEIDGENFAKEETKHDGKETNWDKGQGKESKGKYDGKGVFIENQGSPAKKPKTFSLGKEVNHEHDAKEHQSSISKQEQDGKLSSGQGQNGDSDFDADFSAAKVAAMKAAELVNKNLVGVGYMTADLKKKLLWGSKKSTAVEEPSAHQWDTTLFTDRERQEKFNKLMSLRLPWCLWPIVGREGRAEVGAPTNQPRWRGTSPCREAKGAPDGFRKTIHCWTSKKRWSNCGIGSLSVIDVCSGLVMCFDDIVMRNFSLFCCTRVVFNVLSTTFNGMFSPSPPSLKTSRLWLYAFMKVRKSFGWLNFLILLASFIPKLAFLVSMYFRRVIKLGCITITFLVLFLKFKLCYSHIYPIPFL